MESILLSIQGAIGYGLLWGLMALGVYITFRILDIADLTVDGSFATGGIVCAVCINNGMNFLLAILLATLSGFLAGLITGVLHTKCKIPAILAGILTQISLYSINLRIAGGSNVPMDSFSGIFKELTYATSINSKYVTLVVGLLFGAIVIGICYWFFGTEIGCSIRATGNNEKMARAQSVNTNKMKIIGLMISNGLIALSGALVAQSDGVADVKMGIGAIVIGLASIVIGEVLLAKKKGFISVLIAIILGSVIYRIVVAIVLQMGLNTDDLKLLTAIIVGIALTVPVLLSSHKQKSMYKKLTGQQEDNENA
ncbi:MAG: ABC transporter permease [Thomasclavelia sp.]|jgi:putative ABC transport system permease protein|nr:ABC transporter permease [Thomasclavelia sp.]